MVILQQLSLQELSQAATSVVTKLSVGITSLVVAVLALAAISCLLLQSLLEFGLRRAFNRWFIRGWEAARASGSGGRSLSELVRDRDVVGVSPLDLHYRQLCAHLANAVATISPSDLESATSAKREIFLALLRQEDQRKFELPTSASQSSDESQPLDEKRSQLIAECSDKADFALNDLQAYMGTSWIRATLLGLTGLAMALSVFVAGVVLPGRHGVAVGLLIGLLAGVTAPLLFRLLETIVASR
jgi:hypothetical protein